MPVAAITNPMSGIVKSISLDETKICCSSHEFTLTAVQAIKQIRPMSPIRLYRTAWRAAVFASARVCHHPINKKDIIPTPSQPMKS